MVIVPKKINKKEPFIWRKFSACRYLLTDFLNHILWYYQLNGIKKWSLQDKHSLLGWNTKWKEEPNGSLSPVTYNWKQSLPKTTVKQISSSILKLAVIPIAEKLSPNLTSLRVNYPFLISDLHVFMACVYSFVFMPTLPLSLHSNFWSVK